MLYSKILALRQENSRLTTVNPVLDSFSLDICQEIDLVENDSFINEKKRNVLSLLSNYTVGYSDKLKPALDEYNEAATYLLLKGKGVAIGRVLEKNNEKTPDFRVDVEGKTFFLEMKTLGFAEGTLNYLDAIDKGLDAQISLEQQIKSGKTTAIAETGFDPLYKRKPDYLQSDRVYFIETIVQKIQQNLKIQQFSLGETALFIDLSLIDVPFGAELNSISLFQEPFLKSIVSGLLWHVAFGKLGERVFSPIAFEGAKNVEGHLKIEGILNDFDWIKALCFQIYNVSRQRKIVGFYRGKEEDLISPLLCSFCDFTNDERNANAWEVLQAISSERQ